jgi:hypothetical protein
MDFPTRIQKKSSTAIDNIFIDISKKEEYRIYSLINGLSDHNTQLITIYNIVPYLQENNILTIRKFNENSLNEFKSKLSLETWEDIFNKNDINNMFNAFLNRFLTSYLRKRYGRVMINTRNKYDNTVSDWNKINHGVPQGSILGSLLFLVYINDLLLFLNRISTQILFADDTSVLITSQNHREFNIITYEILQKLKLKLIYHH